MTLPPPPTLKSVSNSKKSIQWMSIPYFPIVPKYIILMIVLFFVGVSGTSLSKFEAVAIGIVAYSTAILLDRAESMGQFIMNVFGNITSD